MGSASVAMASWGNDMSAAHTVVATNYTVWFIQHDKLDFTRHMVCTMVW